MFSGQILKLFQALHNPGMFHHAVNVIMSSKNDENNLVVSNV